MLRHERIENHPAALFQRCNSTRLILLHQPAISYDVGDENSGKAALDAFFGHSIARRDAIVKILGKTPAQVYLSRLRL